MAAQPTEIDDRDDRLHDIVAECLEAAELGQLDRSDFLSRYPEFANELIDFFEGRQIIQQLFTSPVTVGGSDQLLQPGGLAPCVLGDFRIHRELGRGGMGVVYEAEQISLRRTVALKLLPFAAAVDVRQLQRFRIEAQAAAQLHHSNIVPIFAIGCERGVHYYAMQLINGRSLAEWIRELRGADESHDKRTAQPDATTRAERATQKGQDKKDFHRMVARLGMQAAEALEHAHSFGVIHRDIKPANLLIDVRGQLWIADFGLARLQGDADLTRTGDLLGTLRYMSPEQASGGARQSDPRSDVYSLGATLYELLTLEPVIPGNNRQALLAKIASDDPRPMRGFDRSIPADLETIILKAIAKEPAERYDSARALAEDFRLYLADQPIQARRPNWRVIIVRQMRRHRSIVGGVVACMLVALIALSISSLLLWREAEQTRLQKERAEENLRLALDSLDRVYLRTLEERLPRDPRWERQDREILNTALSFYEQLAEQNAGRLKARRMTARAFGRVADIRRRLGQSNAAEAAYRRSIALTESIGNDANDDKSDRAFLAGVWMNLGMLLESNRRLDEAEQAHRRALSIYQQLALDPIQRRNLASSFENLGIVLDAAGRTREAETSYGQALAIREEQSASRPDDIDYREALAATRQHLAHIQRTLGQSAEAEATYRQTTSQFQLILTESPDRVRTRQLLATGRTNLASILEESGRPRDAEQVLRDALDDATRLANDFAAVPEYQRRLAGQLNLLGILLAKMGRSGEAESSFRRALALLGPITTDQTTIDKGRAELADCHHNLGVLLRKSNRPAEAEKHLETGRGIRQALVEKAPHVPQHRQTLGHSHMELGCLFYDRGQNQKAETTWQQGLNIMSVLVRDNEKVVDYRRELASCLYNLARVGHRMRRLVEAESICRRAIEINSRLVDEFSGSQIDLSGLARGQDLLGMILTTMGRTDAAEQVFQRAIATYRRVVKECPQASAYSYSLALTCLHFDAVLLKANRFQESEQLMKEVIAMLDKLVQESPAVAEYRHELANTYTRLASLQERKGDVTEAEKSYRQVLDQYQQLIHDNPELADYREKMGRGHLRLARLLAISKRHAEAEIGYREAIRLIPKDDRPHTNLAWLLIDDGNPSRHNPAEAVTLAEKAVQLNPKSKDNWGILGAAHYRAGSWSKSRNALEEAARLTNGGTAFEGFFLAMAYARLGDAMQARSWFDRSVSWAEEHPARKIELQRLRAETEEVLGSIARP